MRTFMELFNRAAEKLPEGFTIEAHVERSSGWIELYRDGEKVQFESTYEGMDADFLRAIEIAEAQHGT